MGQEGTFRLMLLVLITITMTIAGYYRIQARVAGGSVSDIAPSRVSATDPPKLAG